MQDIHSVDFIIVGQGLAGSLLAYQLLKANFKVLVIDECKKNTSSKIAAGIIHPITGRRMVKSWKADTLIPYAKKLYHEIETEIGEQFFFDLPLIEIFTSVKNRNDWAMRSAEPGLENYIGNEIHPPEIKKLFAANYGGITICNTGFLDCGKLIYLMDDYFKHKKAIDHSVFSFGDLILANDCVKWKNSYASKIIFCDGASVIKNSFFNHLPFLPAKGEILEIFSENLPQQHIISQGMYILPVGNHRFKVGATYEWNFENDEPSVKGKDQIELFLKRFLKNKFQILSHEAAIRPTIQDRRPVIGLHPSNSSIGIFNGLGTKGVMLAPYFANQFSLFLSNKKPIDKEVDVTRFF